MSDNDNPLAGLEGETKQAVEWAASTGFGQRTRFPGLPPQDDAVTQAEATLIARDPQRIARAVTAHKEHKDVVSRLVLRETGDENKGGPSR
jgi:hypothetical protein